jgi:hypothetical protein
MMPIQIVLLRKLEQSNFRYEKRDELGQSHKIDYVLKKVIPVAACQKHLNKRL